MNYRNTAESALKLSILLLFLTASVFGCKTNESKLSPDTAASIRESIQDRGSARLIVGLSGRWDFNSDLTDEQMATLIPRAQQRLLKALERRDFRIDSIIEFTAIPFMAFVIYDEETLNFLISSCLVSSIEEDIAIPAT
jgi:hypothetical protein